ncbi:MAG: PP0621 family protein [Sulfurovum sp.]|jgi:uncharacterized protein
MLMKGLVLALVLILVYLVFFKKSREKEISKNASEKKKEKISDIMVECPTCKTFVSKKEGILSNGNYFCSVECLNNKG